MIDPINPITRKKAKIEVHTFLKVNVPISNRSRKMGGGGDEGIQYIKLAVPVMKVLRCQT